MVSNGSKWEAVVVNAIVILNNILMDTILVQVSMCMIRQCLFTCSQLIQIRTDKLLHKAYLYTGTFHTVKSAGNSCA